MEWLFLKFTWVSIIIFLWILSLIILTLILPRSSDNGTNFIGGYTYRNIFGLRTHYIDLCRGHNPIIFCLLLLVNTYLHIVLIYPYYILVCGSLIVLFFIIFYLCLFIFGVDFELDPYVDKNHRSLLIHIFFDQPVYFSYMFVYNLYKTGVGRSAKPRILFVCCQSVITFIVWCSFFLLENIFILTYNISAALIKPIDPYRPYIKTKIYNIHTAIRFTIFFDFCKNEYFCQTSRIFAKPLRFNPTKELELLAREGRLCVVKVKHIKHLNLSSF